MQDNRANGREYRLEIKVKNNLILEKIEQCGFPSIPKFCKLYSISYSRLLDIIAMKLSPLTADGDFRPIVYKLCEVLLCSPEDLFTETQMNAEISTNKRTIKVNEAEMKFHLESYNEARTIEEDYRIEKLPDAMEKALLTLSPKERIVIKARIYEEKTLDEVACMIGDVSRQRVRQIEMKALRRLRHSSRSEPLQDYLLE